MMKKQNFIFVSAWLCICDVITILMPHYKVLKSTSFQDRPEWPKAKYKKIKLGQDQTLSMCSAALCSTVYV